MSYFSLAGSRPICSRFRFHSTPRLRAVRAPPPLAVRAPPPLAVRAPPPLAVRAPPPSRARARSRPRTAPPPSRRRRLHPRRCLQLACAHAAAVRPCPCLHARPRAATSAPSPLAPSQPRPLCRLHCNHLHRAAAHVPCTRTLLRSRAFTLSRRARHVFCSLSERAAPVSCFLLLWRWVVTRGRGRR
jgi:hypothetical protein